MPKLVRSIGAVVAGIFAIVVLSTGTDLALHAVGALPALGEPMGHGVAALALGYRMAYGALGSYLAAWLAPDRPMRHALALGVVGVVMSALGVAVTWNAGPEFGPRWYPLALLATALPCAWVGGRLYRPRLSTVAA